MDMDFFWKTVAALLYIVMGFVGLYFYIVWAVSSIVSAIFCVIAFFPLALIYIFCFILLMSYLSQV